LGGRRVTCRFLFSGRGPCGKGGNPAGEKGRLKNRRDPPKPHQTDHPAPEEEMGPSPTDESGKLRENRRGGGNFWR